MRIVFLKENVYWTLPPKSKKYTLLKLLEHYKINHILDHMYGVENGNPLQYSCLGNSMDRGSWQATVHGVTELDTTEHKCLDHM